MRDFKMSKSHSDDIRDSIICKICNGFFIEAMRMVECGHTFCRSCIVRYINKEFKCPVCHNPVNKYRLDTLLRYDAKLQYIVSKMTLANVKDEMRQRNTLINQLKSTPTLIENLQKELVKSGEIEDSSQIVPFDEKHFEMKVNICPKTHPVMATFTFPIPQEYLQNHPYFSNSESQIADGLKSDDGQEIRTCNHYFTLESGVKLKTINKILSAKYRIVPPAYIEYMFNGDFIPIDTSFSDVMSIFLNGAVSSLQFYFHVIFPYRVEEPMPTLIREEEKQELGRATSNGNLGLQNYSLPGTSSFRSHKRKHI